MAQGKPGRPTKMTPERVEKLLQCIREGNYYSVACAVAGISYDAFNDWMRRGEEDLAAGRETRFSQFATAVKEAEAAGEAELVAAVKRHVGEQWAAAMTMLERRHPERWGRRDRVAVEGAITLEIKLPDSG